MSTNLQAYVEVYLNKGLKLIPLYSQSKKPLFKGWQNGFDKNRFLDIISEHPSCNIGVLLGEIVDVEGDSPEANDLINELIGDYIHPKYTSNKSTHHFFVNPDPGLTKISFQSNSKSNTKDIEFRASKHMSVLPPSVHESGVRYVWDYNSSWPIPPMPPKLKDFYFKFKNKTRDKRVLSTNHVSKESFWSQNDNKWLKVNHDVKPGHKKILCPICEEIKFVHSKRYRLEMMAFSKFSLQWSCQSCREVDIRKLCKHIRLHSHSL